MKSASQRSNVSLENQAPADVTEGSPAPKPSAFRDKLEEQLGAMNHSPSPSPIAAGAPEPSVDDSMLAPSNTHAAYAAQAAQAAVASSGSAGDMPAELSAPPAPAAAAEQGAAEQGTSM